MGSAVVQLWSELVAPLVVEAAKSFFRTVAIAVAATPLLAGLAMYIAYDGSVGRALVAGLVALAFSGVAMVYVGGHRAAWRALAVGVERLGLGRKALGLVFERLLQVDEVGEHGHRGVGLARAAERVPLAEAEARLSQAVQGLVRASEAERGFRAWLKRALQRKLLEQVERVTLARFREEGAQAGGVDLVKVRDELAARMDGLLLDTVQAALTKVTAIALLATTAGSLGVAVLLRRYAR